MEKKNIFHEFEKILNDSISEDIKKILLRSGFDSKLSILGLNTDVIRDVEQFANEDRSVLEGTSYENMAEFKFKPGHKLTILNLASEVKHWIEKEPTNTQQNEMCEFSVVLKAFIDTATSNKDKQPNGFRYNEINQYFSTFIYLFCGKACYETLSANLPIPQTITIREFSVHILLIFFKILFNYLFIRTL